MFRPEAFGYPGDFGPQRREAERGHLALGF
jgi:hypothetical protein